MNRNEPCPCGSGKRYKHCCGREGADAPLGTRDQALAAHRAGSLGQAETLYRRALAENPGDVDCLHMLGVVQMERLRYGEALDLLWDAAERTAWSVPQVRHNLGLVLGKLMTADANARQAELLADFVEWERTRTAAKEASSPLVTVVLRAHGDCADMAESIRSVSAQTYPHVDLVIVDDRPDDGNANAIAAVASPARSAARVVRPESRGTAAAFNQGAAIARGAYIAFLDGGDTYAPDRFACLVDAIARAGVSWGLSLVSSASGTSEGSSPDKGADISWQRQRNFLGKYSNSLSLVDHNIAVSPGNLFVEREFFRRLGGFRDLRHHVDWDFCLRAIAFAEPIVVARPLYFIRSNAGKANDPTAQAMTDEARRLLGAFLATALVGEPTCTNRFAPQWPDNRALLLRTVLCAPRGALVPVPVLRSTAADWRARRAAPRHATAAVPGARKTALIVLGMHRSGTSAVSRVLNLCGAFLPAKIKPAKLGVNAKGFWEPEEVLEFNGRVLRQLGGEWNRVEFSLPDAGDLVHEFETDARALLASEYGDETTILIKDPRICLLAPLWHRALEAAGYRAVYVVPLRNPLEVARSLHARGDMSIDEGLELWRVYMERVAAFGDAHPDAVVHVSYAELLADWRRVVARIARRLDVSLDAGERSGEVDRFLEADMRHQAASDEELDARLSGVSRDAILTLHRRFLDRCRRDRAAELSAMPVVPVEGRESEPDGSRATASFVLCIENNGIRAQALLLCRSIRQYAGRYRDAQILAYAPRPGLGVDAHTRRALEALDVAYIDAPLNTTCPEYPSANRVFAGAHAEAYSNADFLLVSDSDTVWLDEPELPLDADAAVRPVDGKGSATRGPGDRFEAYWERMARFAGITLDRLPTLRSTIGNERIRASYNGGFTIVRRRRGILTRCAELFAASVGEGIRPYRDSGVEIVASTGRVGREGSEYWGSSQAALTLAIWATTERVLHYPDWYNVPLHLMAFDCDIDPRWLQRSPVHLHYHWMFDERHHENGMELLERLGVPADRRTWLLERTPFRGLEGDANEATTAAGAGVEP